MFLFAMAMGGVILLLNRFIGPRKPSKEKGAPYECGVEPFELPVGRFPIKFYIGAMLFLPSSNSVVQSMVGALHKDNPYVKDDLQTLHTLKVFLNSDAQKI